MEIIYVLIPLSVILLVIAIALFIWAVNSGQFDDMDTPAWRILVDDKPAEQKRNHDSEPSDDNPASREAGPGENK